MPKACQAVEKVKFRSSLFKGWWGAGVKPRKECGVIYKGPWYCALVAQLVDTGNGIQPPYGEAEGGSNRNHSVPIL